MARILKIATTNISGGVVTGIYERIKRDPYADLMKTSNDVNWLWSTCGERLILSGQVKLKSGNKIPDILPIILINVKEKIVWKLKKTE